MKKILILILLALPVLAFGQLDTVNVGSSANSGTGESMRSAFLKVNDHIQAYNAAYLYRLSLSGAHTVALTTTGTTTLTLPTTGTLATTANLVSPAMTAPTVATTINPDANDGATLGQSTTAWSDLFLADGGVINWAAGGVTLAQTNSDYVLLTGDFGISGRVDLSNGGAIAVTGGLIDNTELFALNGVTGGEVMTTESLTDAVLIPVSDTTVTAAVGKIVFKTSDGHFYGCKATTGKKWYQLDN